MKTPRLGSAPLAALALAACLSTRPATAAPGGCTNQADLPAFAFEQITVSTTAIGFTAATAFPTGQRGAIMAVFTVETADVRFRVDGPDPTATVGDRISAGNPGTACGEENIRRTKFIREDGTDATISVHYYREGDQ